MTTVVDRAEWRTDRPIFMAMFAVMALTITAGFASSGRGYHYDYGRLPGLLQLHAAVMATWVLFLMVQCGLVVSGSVALHRRLGWIGAAAAAAIVALGIAATFYVEATNQVPSFFPKSIFLMMNLLAMLAFGALIAAAVRLRNQPDWHKRLMLTACVVVVTPALGRLLPMDAFGAAAPLVLFAVAFAYLAVGMLYDLIARRRVHPAYAWGAGVFIGSQLLTPLIAFSPLGMAATAMLTSRP
jgi:hypothetical protein